MSDQMTIWDLCERGEAEWPEPKVGEFVEHCGAVICHIMRPSYIGSKVLFWCGTQSRPNLYKCGILENYIPYEGHMRCIIFTGEKQRTLITMFPGMEIYETRPWNDKRRWNDEL